MWINGEREENRRPVHPEPQLQHQKAFNLAVDLNIGMRESKICESAVQIFAIQWKC
jgi:hypothetical protein